MSAEICHPFGRFLRFECGFLVSLASHLACRRIFAGEEQVPQEILGKVLDNACKRASHAVRVSVSVPTGTTSAQLCVDVEDDGPGIDESMQQQVLRRGERADDSVPGSGLGLAIVAHLLEFHGGKLQLSQSALGGLKVTLRLPAAG